MAVTSRRLLSLSGIWLGPFFLFHVAINARALRSDSAFAAAADWLHRVPGLALWEWAFVLAPLLVHTSVGLWLVVGRKRIAEPSPYPRRVRTAVRATGIAAIAFLALHLSEVRFRTPGWRLDGGQLVTVLVAGLSSTWHGVPARGAVYLAGTACLAFHFAAGTWGFFATTRIGNGARARRWAAWGAGALGTAMWALLANIVVFHATGSRLIGAAGGDVTVASPCGPSR
jgi:succinate dehydrogenase/fumarate reductase cytochrome b subunit (b558 family)